MINKRKIVIAGVVISLAAGIFTPCCVPQGQDCVMAATRSTTGTQETSTKGKNSSGKAKKTTVAKKKKKAKKYIGKKLTSLVKAIGKYKKLTKAASCYYENEYDGIAKYDGFVVYCHTKNKKTWIVDSVE